MKPDHLTVHGWMQHQMVKVSYDLEIHRLAVRVNDTNPGFHEQMRIQVLVRADLGEFDDE